jgi:hypothetical protein
MFTWGGKLHARHFQVLDFVHHRRHVQQRLGRDAAHVQAHAAQGGVALDQHHLQAQVGRAEGGRVAARATAQHDHVAVHVHRAAKAGGHGAGAAAAGLPEQGPQPQAALVRRSRRGCGSARPRLPATAMTEPSATLSPTLTLSSFTTPAWLEGISMEALSDSTVIRTGPRRRCHLDQQFDHAHFGEVADIGDLDINGCHVQSPLQQDAAGPPAAPR